VSKLGTLDVCPGNHLGMAVLAQFSLLNTRDAISTGFAFAGSIALSLGTGMRALKRDNCLCRTRVVSRAVNMLNPPYV
jgi:hypothetical protein